ncbi:DUF6706 family protein [Spirosoma pollinicola]|uniref:Uncharacterized protein n=1 Tax=Spirosoma pollinicola TaxID=2057025 RepID=A0A2K8YTM7_9BACT|nr:DUF6706 family protein [Spirosoma pollinicola]AUD00939.1 hypothetical protein CWM47_03375 [Spirosoma pollinicola]
MASISETITDRLAVYSIELTPVRLDTLLVDQDLNGPDTYSKAQSAAVKTALLSVLTDLLAMPDVTEGGMSLKWDRSAVQVYCNQLRSDLGLTATSEPSVVDRSNLW